MEATVAEMIEEVHRQNSSSLVYNNEISLASIIRVAYYSAVRSYTIVRELPVREGLCGYGLCTEAAVNAVSSCG